MLDWRSRILLGVTSAVMAFALAGAVLQAPRAPVVVGDVVAVTPTADYAVEAAGEHVTPIPDFALAPAVAPPAPGRPITVALGGDIHAEAPIDGVLAAGENPLAGVAHLLSAADIAIVNVETAIGTTGTPADKTYVFRADPALAPALADAGVDVATLANNHALDFGPDALVRTRDLLAEAGVATVGAGPDAATAYAPHVITVEGHTVAVVGLSRVLPTLAWAATGSRPGLASAYDIDRAVAAVSAAAQVADHVVVTIHWGRERWICPDGAQQTLARALADAGADVIAGHHPHVLQGIETIGDTLVAHSLGNLVFYARTPATRQSGVLTVTLGEGGVDAHRWDPARIDDRGRPQPVTSQEPIVDGEELTGSPDGVGCGLPE